MRTSKYLSQVRRFLYGMMILGLLLSVLYSGSLPTAQAQEAIPETPPPPSLDTEYFTTRTIVLDDGRGLEKIVINGPPTPPPGYQIERAMVELPESSRLLGTNTLTVPAFNWVFGCSSVSGAMIAGYYDRNGFPNMYSGPTNGGVMPLDNSSWPTWSDGTTTYPNLPLAASRQGVDGRTTRGSIDDYWVQYGSSANDSYITGSWTQHTWGDAIGDYMKTSQSAYSNTDGATSFYNWSGSAAQLTCAEMETYSIHTRDGTYGRKLFYEARGYTVMDCYSQKTDNIISGGFSFAQFKAEIDAARPVMLNLAGHTIVGVGYDDSSNTVYIHDTWDYSNHTMTWGGSYAGMTLQSVSIVNLQSLPSGPGAFNKNAPSNAETNQSTSPTLTWGVSSGAISYEYCYDTTNDNACSAWTSNGESTNKSLSGLANGTTYYWQVRATNISGTTYANGASTAFWSFTTSVNPPAAFNKTSPVNGATNQSKSPTLTWGASSGATSYEYCIDTTNNSSCEGSWTNVGSNTSVNLNGLISGATYYWQARARNADGVTDSLGSWWSFTVTCPTPATPVLNSPANGSTGQNTTPTLYWGDVSEATSYGVQVCRDSGCSNVILSNIGGSSQWTVSSTLNKGTTYYWRAEAINSCGSGSWSGTWVFTTQSGIPGAFSKVSPKDESIGQPNNLSLSWGTSSGATSYEYCCDTTNNNGCDGNWISTGTGTSAALLGLNAETIHYWQVRARNAAGTTDADSGTWWNFATCQNAIFIYLPMILK